MQSNTPTRLFACGIQSLPPFPPPPLLLHPRRASVGWQVTPSCCQGTRPAIEPRAGRSVATHWQQRTCPAVLPTHRERLRLLPASVPTLPASPSSSVGVGGTHTHTRKKLSACATSWKRNGAFVRYLSLGGMPVTLLGYSQVGFAQALHLEVVCLRVCELGGGDSSAASTLSLTSFTTTLSCLVSLAAAFSSAALASCAACFSFCALLFAASASSAKV